MRIMNCPLNGPRNISEFVWMGEVRSMPDPATSADRDWASHLFLEKQHRRRVDEWWITAPSNYWFIARRNTVTDEVLETMTLEQVPRRGRVPSCPDSTPAVGRRQLSAERDLGQT
jgi:sarcosine oxidase subunit delta